MDRMKRSVGKRALSNNQIDCSRQSRPLDPLSLLFNTASTAHMSSNTTLSESHHSVSATTTDTPGMEENLNTTRSDPISMRRNTVPAKLALSLPPFFFPFSQSAVTSSSTAVSSRTTSAPTSPYVQSDESDYFSSPSLSFSSTDTTLLTNDTTRPRIRRDSDAVSDTTKGGLFRDFRRHTVFGDIVTPTLQKEQQVPLVQPQTIESTSVLAGAASVMESEERTIEVMMLAMT